MLKGAVVPSFGSFWYYYLTQVKGFSQFVYGMTNLIGQVSLLIGAVLYNRYLQPYEFRTLLSIANLIAFFAAVLGIIFILDLHKLIWIPDILFFCIQAFFEDSLLLAFVDLPAMVLFAKVTPKRIEGTVFALLTGIINFTYSLSTAMGGFINDAFLEVPVTKDNLSNDNFLVLVSIECGCCLLPLFFMFLIPLRKTVEELQEKFALEEAAAQGNIEAILKPKEENGEVDSSERVKT